ncbi:hypothetical protein B0H15DRAFT_954102 [Mycena belliarum]|uniref:Uncharacterized protein n=1 Tax=Mycena belliarum TaxID=1033014 RepID=A0AAD6XJL6_9AGAR|nr:hypothetical protein B0H15DRAFT_954102 [Mycena belliae]
MLQRRCGPEEREIGAKAPPAYNPGSSSALQRSPLSPPLRSNTVALPYHVVASPGRRRLARIERTRHIVSEMRPAAATARDPCHARSAARESAGQCARVAPRRRHPCPPHAVLPRPLAAVPDAGERAATPNAADSGGVSCASRTNKGCLRWRSRAALPLVRRDRLGYGRAGGRSNMRIAIRHRKQHTHNTPRMRSCLCACCTRRAKRR